MSLEQLGNYDAFVMGRVTYQKFYANWGHITGNPYIDLISAMPKYVASGSLTETTWNERDDVPESLIAPAAVNTPDAPLPVLFTCN